MTAGKIKIGNLILRLEGLDGYKGHQAAYEQWDSEDGSFQIQVLDTLIEMTFLTTVLKNRANLLDEVNGKTLPISSDIFNTFYGVVATHELAVSPGMSQAKYKIEIKEDNPDVQKPA